jgi:hypothetical protein
MKIFTFLILLFLPPSVFGQCLFNDGGEPFNNYGIGFSDTEGCTLTKENTPLCILVYPNPTTDILMIDCKEKRVGVQIYDVTGRKILETNDDVLDVSNFAQGSYFLYIEKQVFKIIKI